MVMNSPDPDIFTLSRSVAGVVRSDGRLKPLRDYVSRFTCRKARLGYCNNALGKVKKSIPHAELVVCGQSTPFLQQVMASLQASPLREAVRYLGRKNLEEIVADIRKCDVGIIPNRRSIFTELNTPTRIFEYLSQGKPVIAPRAPGILDYFEEQDLIFFELGDADDLATKIQYSFTYPEEVRRIIERGQAIYRDPSMEQRTGALLTPRGRSLAG